MPDAPPPSRVAAILAATLFWADPALRAGRWPASDSTSSDPRMLLASHLASRDSARIRRGLAWFDSVAAGLQGEADDGSALAGALGHLAVNDTAGALVHLRRFQAVTWSHSPILDQISSGFTFSGILWPRMFLLLGDLEAARGNRAEAVRAYRTFLGFWQGGDAAVQPFVERARQAVSRLSQ